MAKVGGGGGVFRGQLRTVLRHVSMGEIVTMSCQKSSIT